MSKKRTIKRNQEKLPHAGVPLTEPPPHSAFVITIAFDPKSDVVNYNTVRQGDGVVYVDDQINALRKTYESFVGRLAVEVAKAEQAQMQEAKKE